MNIGFIGAGKVGTALGLYFKRYGLNVMGYYSRTAASALAAAGLTASDSFPDLRTLAGCCDVIFITTSDSALREIDGQAAVLTEAKAISADRCWIHVSGALPSDCLAGLKAAGCPVGSMHPLQSFGDPKESATKLDRTLFSVEGTERAVETIRCILRETGGNFSRISTQQKPLYHAGACVVSNYLVTLLDCGMKFFEAAGLERDTIYDAISPLLESTLANVREKGTVEALTGPIVRGDCNTLRVHLQALKRDLPTELQFYKAMAIKTVEMIAEQRISEEQEKSLIRIMEE